MVSPQRIEGKFLTYTCAVVDNSLKQALHLSILLIATSSPQVLQTQVLSKNNVSGACVALTLCDRGEFKSS